MVANIVYLLVVAKIRYLYILSPLLREMQAYVLSGTPRCVEVRERKMA